MCSANCAQNFKNVYSWKMVHLIPLETNEINYRFRNEIVLLRCSEQLFSPNFFVLFSFLQFALNRMRISQCTSTICILPDFSYYTRHSTDVHLLFQ